jgi:hypothetical protein
VQRGDIPDLPMPVIAASAAALVKSLDKKENLDINALC